MPPKKKAMSLADLNQQLQAQQQAKLQEQQAKLAAEKQEALKKKEDKKQQKEADKKKKKQDTVATTAAPPSTPKSAASTASHKQDSKDKINYKITDECHAIMNVIKETLTEQVFDEIDFPIIFFLSNVIAAQNNVQTKIKENDVIDLVATYVSQTTYKSFDDSKGITQRLMGTLKERGIVKEIKEEAHSVKVLEEAMSIGKHFEDQLKQQQKMMKSLNAAVPTNDDETQVNYNDQLDWDAKAQQKITDKKKRKEDKERAAKQKEYDDFLKARGLTSAKGIVKVHHADVAIQGSRDIVINKATVTVGSRTLLENASVHLMTGKRFGLIGKNGVGKTTFLRHIAEREFEGIPPYLQIIHVEQEILGDDTTALDAVLKTDVERERLMQEEKALLASGSKADADRLSEIYARMDEIDAYTAESRAAAILSGLSFTPEMQQTKTKHFSGGWRMRIALARALFVEPDVLLLDEPTNHLDLHAVLWLENYLQTWERLLVIVSHSRSFLNAVATDIIHFYNNELKIYKGNYDTFEKTRMDQLTMQQKAHEAQERQRKHHQQFIDRFRYKASTASMVQSRLKLLEKMQFMAAVAEDPTFQFAIPSPDAIPPPYIQAIDVTFGYQEDKILFKDLNFHLDNDSRIALVGPNGSGKSTFMKVLTSELKPMQGYVTVNKKIRIARFSQHHMDHLNVQMNPLEYMMSKYPGETEQTLRSHLGSLGLSGPLALQAIYTLSGGQRSRVVFAEITFKKPHLLLLDEPTNFLDLDTVDALIQALNEYGGGCLIISHDEHLITRVCDEIWVCGAGRIEKFNGDFETYKKTIAVHF